MSKNKNKKKQYVSCKTCEFYDRSRDVCSATGQENCSKKNKGDCQDYLIRDDLIHY